MPFVAPKKCPKCGKSVYHAEEILAAGEKFHKSCFNCELCNKKLDSTTVCSKETKIYCKSCYGRQFGPKGYGYGGGAGVLSTDRGEQFGLASNVQNKPSVPLTSSTGTIGGGSRCPRCGKSVYQAEKAIGAPGEYHKSCFTCKECNKSLDSTTMAQHEQEVYCKGCYGRNFGPKGYGYGMGAGALSTTGQ